MKQPRLEHHTMRMWLSVLLGIAYGNATIESAREGDLVIGHLEGTSWVPVPGQQVDQSLDFAEACGAVVEFDVEVGSEVAERLRSLD